MTRSAHPARRAAAVAAALALAGAADAQQTTPRPLGGRDWSVGPVFETWTLSRGATLDAAASGDSGQVKSATQFSVPVVAVYSLGNNWLLDAYMAYATGTVKLRDNREFKLSGPTDLKLRASSRILGENLLFTVGLNIPTGKTKLDSTEQTALRVLGSPGFRFQTPGLGSGASGTTGLVLTKQIAGWAWGLGASYEVRGKYSPFEAIETGAPTGSGDLNPGSAVRVSLGTDGLLGQSATSFSIAGTFYTKDRLETGQTDLSVQLGPQMSAEWEMRFAAPGFSTLTAYAFDRYRTEFKATGRCPGDNPPTDRLCKVADSDGNELEFGLFGALPLRGKTALTTGLDGRWHTGIGSDQSISTPGVLGFGATVGLAMSAGRYSIRPFVRGQVSKMDTAGNKVNGTGFGAGITLGSSLP